MSQSIRYPDETTINRLAQTFYEAAGLSMAMTDKPKVVAGLEAVFNNLQNHDYKVVPMEDEDY